MTSQLILGNGNGLALASDSATTLQTPEGSRTYEDATKICPLPEPHPVAILQAGTVDLLGMPLGVLINQWQASLGGLRMSLEGYRDSLLSWLGHNLDNWTTQNAMDDQAYKALRNELLRLRRKSLPILKGGEEEWLEGGLDALLATVPDEEHHDATLRAIQARSEWVAGSLVFDPALPPMADGLFDRLGSRSQENSWTPDSVIASAFEGLPQSEQIDQAIHELFHLMVGRNYSITGIPQTHLTFAGYGSDELIPSVASVLIEGAMENHIARSSLSTKNAKRLGVGFALYEPVAQHDTIEMVISGHNPKLLQDAIRDVVGPYPVPSGGRAEAEGDLEDISDSDPDEGADERGAIEEWNKAQQWGEEVFERAIALSDRQHFWKFMRTVAALEIPSLTDTARSLVAVEALSKELRAAQPTVGGNIDVATITLADGFRWVGQQ